MRPRLHPDERAVLVAFRASPRQVSRLQKLAFRFGKHPAELLRKALKLFLDLPEERQKEKERER